MYVSVANILLLVAIIHTPAPQTDTLSQSSPDSPVATVADNEKPTTSLDSWLHQIRDGSPRQRREAAANPPSDARLRLVIDALSDAANDVHLDVRTAAIFSLGDLGDMEVVPLLHNKLASRAPKVRSAAIWALASLGNADAEPQVRKLLIDSNDGVRLAASWYFAKIAVPRARSPLLASLGDENAKVRVAAVWGLSATGIDEHLELVRMKLQDPSSDVRSAAARALGRADDRKSSKALKQALSDIESSVRIAAASALTELGEAGGAIADEMTNGKAVEWDQLDSVLGADAVPFLIALLQSNESGVRANSAIALGESGDQRAEPALRELSESPDLSDRIAATNALATLGDWSLPVRFIAAAWAAITSRTAIILVGVLALAVLLGLYIFLIVSKYRA